LTNKHKYDILYIFNIMSGVTSTPKSPELLQAQMASFATEQVEGRQERAYIFDNIGTLAVQTTGDISDETANGYVNFLRSVGGSRHETIQGRAELLEAFKVFEPVISKLRSELEDPDTRKEHPNYLGSGSNSMVFSIESGDQEYAVRVPVRGGGAAAIDSHLAGAVLGRGIPHLEQIVAASYEEGVTVAEIMPGKDVGDLSLDEILGISDEQLSEFADTLIIANEGNIEIDPKPSNFLYDPKEGYGVVDYHPAKSFEDPTIPRRQSPSLVVGEIASTVIDNTGFYGSSGRFEESVEGYGQKLAIHKANLGTMKRYRNIVEGKLEGDDQRKVLNYLDMKITGMEELVIGYSDPVWVADRIAQAQERERIRVEQANNPTFGWMTLDTL
jgi:hypothetical protein